MLMPLTGNGSWVMFCFLSAEILCELRKREAATKLGVLNGMQIRCRECGRA